MVSQHASIMLLLCLYSMRILSTSSQIPVAELAGGNNIEAHKVPSRVHYGDNIVQQNPGTQTEEEQGLNIFIF